MLSKEKHHIFKTSGRRHVLVITNHGCHAPVITLTTDTGGQNFYVNDLCRSLLKLGYKVTILNRGGYRHPATGLLQKGVVYYDRVWGDEGLYCRILYLEDGTSEFIEKEKLTHDHLHRETDFFFNAAARLKIDLSDIYLILSHYWDGGMLGLFINEGLRKKTYSSSPHIWTPHSLGRLKRKNYKNASRHIVKALNFPFRIRNEERIIALADGVVSTSDEIRSVLAEYKSSPRNYFYFPPGIDMDLFKPRKLKDCSKALTVLENVLGLDESEVIRFLDRHVLFVESGRTAKPKQKDVLLRSFAQMKNHKNASLIMTIDKNTRMYKGIYSLYKTLNTENNIYLIDRYLSDEELSELYSLADVYVTCSVMEGWGMAVQEAAASKCALVSSKFIPFVNELIKQDALIAQKHTPSAYAEKMDTLVNDPDLRDKMAFRSYKTVIKNCSWRALTRNLIADIKKRGIFR